ncbi:granzyme B-like [Hoplias malabaricus]|uniref:granzyme B-like n=1 Tax=Hoplias malabaricus TaxID=27720 RepID=UPI003462690E
MILPMLILYYFSLSEAMGGGIIGGQEANPHSRPYMVSLQLYQSHMCGGMLIRKDYVLTSAHCLDTISCSENLHLQVVLGAHNLKENEFGRQSIKVQKCIKHPLYKKGEMHHDIMLLKLKTKAKENKFVRVIALPKKNKEIPAQQYCSIAGWGMTKPNGSASDVLQEVKLKLQFKSECKNIWKNYFDTEHMICTVSNGKEAFCQGDSGSPLLCKNKPYGIAAFTYRFNCKSSKYPQVYMKIAYFLPWIKNVIGQNLNMHV